MAFVTKHTFSAEQRTRLQKAISLLESGANCSVRILVRERRSREERTLSVEEIAHEELARAGSSGRRVLVLLMMRDREFAVVASGMPIRIRDAARRVSLVESVTAELRQGKTFVAMLALLGELGGVISAGPADNQLGR